jgi:hypothetical protein
MDFFKALLPGSLLTFVVSALMGKGGSRGGWLYIERIHIDSHSFYWSWTLLLSPPCWPGSCSRSRRSNCHDVVQCQIV